MTPPPALSASSLLERAWLALACAALVTAALFAVVIATARTPWLGAALGLQALFAPALVVHVMLATVVWLLGMGAAQWVVIAPMNRTCGWIVFIFAALGALSLPAALLADGRARLFNYLPMLDHPLFLSGIIWFALALLVLITAATIAALRKSAGHASTARGEGLAVFALRAAMIPAWMTVIVLVLGWTKLPVMGSALEHGEWLFWAPGHTLQFVFTALMVAAWIGLSPAPATATRRLRFAVWLTVLPVVLAPLPFASYTIDSAPFRNFFTWLMALGTWFGPMAVALLLVQGTRPGERLASFATLSIALFALGAFVGALIDANTTTVPAHYHGTVGAATLAAMGLACARLGIARKARDALPWLYLAGFALIVVGFAIAGTQSAPRKLPEVADGLTAGVGFTLMGVGAAAAIAGVLWFGVQVARALLPARRRVSTRPAIADRRPRALAATAISIALLGGLFAWGDRGGSERAASVPAGLSQRDADEVRQRFEQGVVMLHARQYDHAVTAFHRVLALAPEMPEAYVNMGFALLGLQRHREAGDFFASAIELRREQINAYYGLAVALEAGGDLRGAIGAMRVYIHRAAPADPYRRKAESALWEWETQLAQAPDQAVRRR